MAYKIKVDQDLCIGCRTCVSVCPELFAFDDAKAKAKPKKASVDDAGCAEKAASSCPAQAISVEET